MSSAEVLAFAGPVGEKRSCTDDKLGSERALSKLLFCHFADGARTLEEVSTREGSTHGISQNDAKTSGTVVVSPFVPLARERSFTTLSLSLHFSLFLSLVFFFSREIPPRETRVSPASTANEK